MAFTVVNSDGTSSSIIVQFNPTTQLPIKLTGSQNFATWKAHVSSLLNGHDLYGHLDGSVPIPEKTITQNNTTTPNPAEADPRLQAFSPAHLTDVKTQVW